MSSERTNGMTSVLGPEVVVIGNVSGQGDLEIRGRLQGNLRLEGRLLLAKGGTIVGNVEASSVAVAGTMQGDIEARDGIEIQGAGSVEGNMTAPRIGIETGAQVRGMLATGPQGSKKAEMQGAKKAEARTSPFERPAPPQARVVEQPLFVEPIVAPENESVFESDSPEPEFDDEEADLEEAVPSPSEGEPGQLRARRKKRRRRKRPEASGPRPDHWSEERLPNGPPAAPTTGPDGAPRPAAFQKGTQAQRRRS